MRDFKRREEFIQNRASIWLSVCQNPVLAKYFPKPFTNMLVEFKAALDKNVALPRSYTLL